MIHVENVVAIDDTVGHVFTIVGDPTKDPGWHFDVVEASSASDNGVGGTPIAPGTKFKWVFDYMGEGRKDAVAEVKAFEPNRRLDVYAVSGSLEQTISYRFEPTGETSSRVTRILDLDDEDLPADMEAAITPRIEARGALYLQALKKLVEDGVEAPAWSNSTCACG